MTRTFARSAAALVAVLALSCDSGRSSVVPPDPTYTINLRYCSGTSTTSCEPASVDEFPQEYRDVFRAQAERIERTITAGLPPLNVAGVSCGSGADEIPIREEVHGLLILVSIRSDLGTGTLAQSGPCIIRSRSGLPVVAVLRFNSAYISDYHQNGQLETVVLHEMFHTLGFGTVWCEKKLLSGARESGGECSALPIFTGRQAISAAKAQNGAPAAWTSLPAEDLGGAGTVLSHWRESVFHSELMTGWVEPTPAANPLSAMTIASLADLGYPVDLSQADVSPAYVVPSPSTSALRAPSSSAIFLGDDVLREPPVVVEEP